jgi:hypothetical protein
MHVLFIDTSLTCLKFSDPCQDKINDVKLIAPESAFTKNTFTLA